jgi:hypothetical protein
MKDVRRIPLFVFQDSNWMPEEYLLSTSREWRVERIDYFLEGKYRGAGS